MASSVDLREAPIVFHVAWQGPTVWLNGSQLRQASDVALKLRKESVVFEMNPSYNIEPKTLRRLPLTCESIRRANWLLHKIPPDVVRMSVENLRKLEVHVRVFREDGPGGPMFLDESTGKFIQQKTYTKIDQTIGLNIPRWLKLAHEYRIVIRAAKEHFCTATLEDTRKDAANYDSVARFEKNWNEKALPMLSDRKTGYESE